MKNSTNVSTSASIGGPAASAKAGSGYNQGNQIAATGNFHGGIGTHKDLRGGSAPASTGFHLGTEVAGKVGGDAPEGVGKMPTAKGSASNIASGYNQGAQIAANKK